MVRKVFTASLCISIILAAMLYLAVRASYTDRRERELYQEAKIAFCCDQCGEVQLTMGEWVELPRDPETGYRRCPICGHYSLASDKRICTSCKRPVGWPPPPGILPQDYLCPLCGKHVLPEPNAAP